MNNDLLEIWIQQMISCLRNLPGGVNADAIENLWREHKLRMQPVVTIYGSYDTGKSSLLKRLLVDEDKNVPDWLTVSARRETFEIHETEAFGCTFRDTPGISGGNTEHERVANEALALSDAFLVVLAPQILTSEREQILKLLSGQLFSKNLSNPFLPHSLIIVISRMDEAGIDPTEDKQAYQELVQRKQVELQNILSKNNIDTSLLKIHAVAADPYQFVGNTQQPLKCIYDEFRSWDGINYLTKSLQSLTETEYVPELRIFSAIRYFYWIGEQALIMLNKIQAKQEAIFEESRNWYERIYLIENQLDALINAAKVDLEGKVEEVLISVSRYDYSTVDELKKILESRLCNAFEEWVLRHDSELNKLVCQAGIELKERAARPGAKRLFEFFELKDEDESPSFNTSRLREILHQFQHLLNHSLKHFYEFKLGMTLEEAHLELNKLFNFDGINKYINSSNTDLKPQSAQNLQELKQYIGIYKALETVTPVIIELGTLVIEEIQQQQVAEQRSQQRAKLREIISSETHKIANGYFDEWKQNSDTFKDWLQQHKSAYARNKQLLEEQINQVNQHLMSFQEILVNVPF